MDGGTTLSYITFYIASFGIAYYYFTTRNKERMALISSGANPDLLDSKDKYYMLFIIGCLVIGISLGVGMALILVKNKVLIDDQGDKKFIYLFSVLFFSGVSLLFSFFTVRKWLKEQE